MTETADVVVVGLGAIGAATLLALARRGVRTLGIDRFDPPHDRGSTHGESRITRLAIAEGPEYVPLVRRSHEIWRELEAETGETLLLETGGLIIGTGEGAPSHGQPGFLGSTVRVAEQHAIPHEILGAAEIRHRYPQFNVGDAERAYYEPSMGMAFPERAVAVQLRLARERGARVRPNETVLSIEPCGAGVAITTDRGRVEAARAILAAGAWLPALAGGHLARVATVQRQTFLWFAPDQPALYDPARCPVFIWQHGPDADDYLYGFPIIPGGPPEGAAVKAGTERYGASIDPNAVDRVVTDQEARDTYHRHIEGRLNGLSDRLLRAATCLYTVTPDAGFVLDHAHDGTTILASTCSGHGFKHSPALGERLAAMAIERSEPAREFAIARFA